MSEIENAPFNDIERRTLESLIVPLAVYQFINKKVVPILVSDGLCKFEGMTRDDLLYMFTHDMYRNVHPEDAKTIPQAAYDFAVKGGEYNVTYREKLRGSSEYSILHASGEHVWKDNGVRLAYIRYEDITSALNADAVNAIKSRKELSNFFDNNTGAMVVTLQSDNRLIYYNKAMCRIIQPSSSYDSGITFNKFFYGDDSSIGINDFAQYADTGPHVIVEPRSGRKLEVSVLSSSWEDKAAYLIYFYECESEDTQKRESEEKRHKRITFNTTMLTGESNNRDYIEPGYKGFWIWNLSDGGKLIRDEGHSLLHKIREGHLSFEEYRIHLLPLTANEESNTFLEASSLQQLISLYYAGTYPRTTEITINSREGNVTLKCDLLMLESPDSGDVYLKVTEENVTNEQVLRTMIHTLLGERFDFIAYIDATGGSCRIFDEKFTAEDTLSDVLLLKNKYKQISERIGIECANDKELIISLINKCGDRDELTETVTFKGSKQTKSIHINVLDKACGRYFITSSDITEPIRHEKELQQKLQNALADAEKVGIERDSFIARTSHDLRTPLSAVISLSSFGIDEAKTQQTGDYFKKIHSSAAFMLSMLNDIIEIEKLRSGTIELHPTVANRKEFVQEIETILRPHADEKHITLTIKPEVYGPEGSLLKLDHQRVQQVLNNILSNAIKYTPEGGAVVWSCCDSVKENGVHVTTHVISDTGVGMSEEFQKHMFEPYTREQNSQTAKETGTGLGLAIVKRLSDALGGTISVQSELGKGSTFTVVIPYEYVEPSSINTKNTSSIDDVQTFDFTNKTILVCDDNEINQEIIATLLEKTNAHVIKAYNGKEGVSLAITTKCDAILMDIMMPIMDGLEATKTLRKRKCEIPIIALSANANESDVEKSLAAGMNAHLTKPIDPDALYKTLAEFIH